MSTCATEPCVDVDECCLAGGCVRVRFPGQQPAEIDEARQRAKVAAAWEKAQTRSETWWLTEES